MGGLGFLDEHHGDDGEEERKGTMSRRGGERMAGSGWETRYTVRGNTEPSTLTMLLSVYLRWRGSFPRHCLSATISSSE